MDPLRGTFSIVALNPQNGDLEAAVQSKSLQRRRRRDVALRRGRRGGDAGRGAAAFTGGECTEWAGHVTGAGFAAQGNILAGAAVERARRRARSGRRRPAATGAASSRRRSSSSDRGGIPDSREGIERIVDLRVDDHEEPIRELRRLQDLHTRMRLVLDTAGPYERRE